MSWFKAFVERGFGSAASKWLGEGIPCETLRVGGGWEKGRVRIRLEFVPDEPTPEAFDAVRSPSEQ